MNFLPFLLLFFLISSTIDGTITITEVENNAQSIILQNSRGNILKTYMPGSRQAKTNLLSRSNKRKLTLATAADTYRLVVQKITVNDGHNSFIALLLHSNTTNYIQSLLLSDNADESLCVPLKLTVDSQNVPSISLLPNNTCNELDSYSGAYNEIIQNPIIQIYLGALSRNKLQTKEKKNKGKYQLNITYKKKQATLQIHRKKITALPVPLIEVSLKGEKIIESHSVVLLEKKNASYPIGIIKKNGQLELSHDQNSV